MSKSKLCKECALGLFNDKCCNLEGVGNTQSGTMIVVPNVDYDAYKNKSMEFSNYVDIIKSILSSTGGIEQVFIVPLIRCKLNSKCPVDKNIIRRCMLFSFRDIRVYNIKKVMLLGDAARYMNFSNAEKETIHLVGNVGYTVSYSPFVKFKDDAKYKELCNHLIQWISANKDNNYNGMKIIRYDT